MNLLIEFSITALILIAGVYLMNIGLFAVLLPVMLVLLTLKGIAELYFFVRNLSTSKSIDK